MGISGNVQECTDIRFKSSWDHIPKRHLGATSDALEHHLDGDGMVQTSVVRGGSHFGNVSRKADMVAWGGDEYVNAVIGGRDKQSAVTRGSSPVVKSATDALRNKLCWAIIERVA